MTDEKVVLPAEKAPKEKGAGKMEPKEKWIRAMISFLTSDKAAYYVRGERVYVDTAGMKGGGLMLLDSQEFKSYMLETGKKMDNLLLRNGDAELVIDHVRYHASKVAVKLSEDNRAAHREGRILLNTGWIADQLLEIDPVNETWEVKIVEERIFEPIPAKMRLAQPVVRPAMSFPTILKEGLANFGESHCLIAATCATMLLPATFPHPFLVFTGDQARGKSTTMKLLLQLIDPKAGGELMSVGEDTRDLIALCRDRHCIAMDNVSHLPFDEDLLSKMYSGGSFAARKMTTNSELSEAEMPRLRVLMNGIGPAFSRSDLMSRCIFIDHPVLTKRNERGKDVFVPLEHIEERWAGQLPEALGSLLAAVAAGWKLFQAQGGLACKTSECRYVEYAVIGECMAQVMGFEPGMFTEQVYKAAASASESAIEADDCAQLVLAYLNGERGHSSFSGFDDNSSSEQVIRDSDGSVILSSTLFHKEIRQIAQSRNYTTYGMKWLMTVKSFSTAIVKSRKNIENGGWAMFQLIGGPNNRKWKCTKVNG